MAAVPLVFVFGTGRCGTQTLWKLFESLPNTLSMHEGKGIVRAGPAAMIGEQLRIGWIGNWNTYLYHAANEDVFRRSFDPDPDLAVLIESTFQARSTLIEWCEAHGLAYCDSNPYAYNLITYLYRKYPHAKFIHLVRDGYDCVRSWFRRSSTYPDHLTDLREMYWLLAKPVPLASDPAHAAWPAYDRVQRISWFWNTVNANIIERFAGIPAENRLLLRIEDLTKETTPRLLAFCGLPQSYAPETLAPGDPSSGPSIEWTSDQVRKFNELAAPMMRELAYALR